MLDFEEKSFNRMELREFLSGKSLKLFHFYRRVIVDSRSFYASICFLLLLTTVIYVLSYTTARIG